MQAIYRPTLADINLDHLRANYNAFREALPTDMLLLACVKANAYGHGAVEVARELQQLGADYLSVAFLDEALELRQAGITLPILVLGYTPPDGVAEALKHDITLTVYSDDVAEALARLPASSRRLKVHVKIDTGMGRLGFTHHEEALSYIAHLQELPSVHVEGVFTHYARADEADKRSVLAQYERFRELIGKLESRGMAIPYIHAGNSATAIDTPELGCNMVRLGISMYGMYPSGEVDRGRIGLTPLLRLVSRVIMVKDVPPGTPIGYGGTYVTAGEARIATIPIGYADGYSRLLSGKAHVLIHGERRPVVGRVCMDQCMVDVTGMAVKPGDEVVLIGAQGDASIPAEELAEQLGTINYEVTSMIAARVPKVYVRGGVRVDVVNPLLHQFSTRKKP